MLYPNKIQKNNKSTIAYANRGMDLEYLINEANLFYKNEDIEPFFIKKKNSNIEENNNLLSMLLACQVLLKFKKKMKERIFLVDILVLL